MTSPKKSKDKVKFSRVSHCVTFARHDVVFFKNSTKNCMNLTFDLTIDDIMETFASMFDVGHSYHHLH